MNKIMDYVSQLVLDESFRYPGLVKRNQDCRDMPDPLLWANGVLWHDSLSETPTIDLRNL